MFKFAILCYFQIIILHRYKILSSELRGPSSHLTRYDFSIISNVSTLDLLEDFLKLQVPYLLALGLKLNRR